MGRNYVHTKQFLEFRGIDLRSSEVLREPGFASDGTVNVMHSPQGGLMCRPGTHEIEQSVLGVNGTSGQIAFRQTDMLGNTRSEVIIFGSTAGGEWLAHRKEAITITNSHATDAATCSMYYDTSISNWRFKITRGGVDIVTENLGTGPMTLNSLRTIVNAAASLSMSAMTYVGSQYARNLEPFFGLTIAANGGTLTIYAYYNADLAEPTQCAVRQPGLFGNDAYTPTSAVVLNNVVYVATGGYAGTTGYLSKFDGNRIYRAGIPKPKLADGSREIGSLLTANVNQVVTDDVRGAHTVTASGSTHDSMNYKARIVNVDKAGNRTEGHLLFDNAGASAQIYGMEVLTTGSGASLYSTFTAGGFNVAYAMANGAQNNVATITVDAGHTMQAGDIAYFWDNSQNRFIQREVTATAATTITVSTTSLDSDTTSDNYDDGGNVNVLDNCLFTNNSRLAIYRELTPNVGDYKLIAEVTNLFCHPSHALYYYDNMTDASLTERPDLIEPEFPPDPPPENCKFISVYNGGLVLSGNYKSPNTVYYSDVEGPESWPEVTHNFELEAPVVGHKQSGEVLVCGTANSLHVTSGNLSEFNFRVDQIGTNIGITSHASMSEIEEGVLCFSSNVGPYVLFGGRRLEPLGAKEYPDGSKVSRLEPFWTKSYATGVEKPVFKRAQAVVIPDLKLYLLFVPFEDPTEVGFATTSSVVWAFDYGRGTWWKWTGAAVNMAGGACIWDGDLVFNGVTQSGAGVTYANALVTRRILTRKASAGAYAYDDHGSTITWTYRSHWESLGSPSTLKRFLRCRVSSHETRLAGTTTVDLNTYVDYSTSNTSNDDTLTFTTQLDLKPKLKAENCRSMMIEFTKSVRHDPIPISGYELEAVAQFRPEMKE